MAVRCLLARRANRPAEGSSSCCNLGVFAIILETSERRDTTPPVRSRRRFRRGPGLSQRH